MVTVRAVRRIKKCAHEDQAAACTAPASPVAVMPVRRMWFTAASFDARWSGLMWLDEHERVAWMSDTICAPGLMRGDVLQGVAGDGAAWAAALGR